MTYREAIYMVFDMLKIASDDSYWEEEHIIFILNKYRSILLAQKYKGIKVDIPISFYQQIPISLIKSSINDMYTSTEKIPNIVNLNGIILENFISDELNPTKFNFNFTTIQRLKFVGFNKWLKNELYFALDYDNHLYVKCGSDSTPVPNKILGNFILDNPLDILKFLPEEEIPEDPIDYVFPVEGSLVQTIIEMSVKELSQSLYLPEDKKNNSTDNLSEIKTK